MGIAADALRLKIGGTNTVWYYCNQPAVAQKLEPAGKYDGCYLPRRIHVTGDIDIHELAWDKEDELWVVNTRFGCLCTLDADHSFYPRWRPAFLSALASEDRCHLNGFGLSGWPAQIRHRPGRDGYARWMAREQGAGDAIQFARYLPLAAERVGRLMLVCRAELMPLFATLPGIVEIREPGTFQVGARSFGNCPPIAPCTTSMP